MALITKIAYIGLLNVVGHSTTESLRDPKSRVQIRRGESFSPTPIVKYYVSL